MKRPSLLWTKHLPEKEREDFEKIILSSNITLSRLKQIVEDKLADLETIEIRKETYESSAYPYLQAHLNGRKAELLKLLELLNFVE